MRTRTYGCPKRPWTRAGSPLPQPNSVLTAVSSRITSEHCDLGRSSPRPHHVTEAPIRGMPAHQRCLVWVYRCPLLGLSNHSMTMRGAYVGRHPRRLALTHVIARPLVSGCRTPMVSHGITATLLNRTEPRICFHRVCPRLIQRWCARRV